MDRTHYTSPFMERYGTDNMRLIFSDNQRHMLWRTLWYNLARAEYVCGAPITDAQLTEIGRAVSEPIDYDKVKEYEDKTHHDVVAHLTEFGDHCPNSKGVLHLGATSCYISDNSDIIIMRAALLDVEWHLRNIINMLCSKAREHTYAPLVGRTHLQKAQLTTVGKRICMWINDFMIDYDMLKYTSSNIKLLGCKGATGSQSSLCTLFNGNYQKALMVDDEIKRAYNIDVVEISGQTYTRKYDSMVANTLSQIAQSASKMATDIRLMSAFGEMYEGFDKEQVGSSAMPYKRNPITCEKICGISRHVICNAQNTAITASTQWLERTLDDSSNKRIVIAELFLGISEILRCIENVITNMVIDTDTCLKHAEEHSKMASLEDDIIRDVMNGGDRQDGHKNAIWSDGSDNAKVNTGFAGQQAINYCHKVTRKLRDLNG